MTITEEPTGKSKATLAKVTAVIEELDAGAGAGSRHRRLLDKERIVIALSDRAPISIVEAEWPLVATKKIQSPTNPPMRPGSLSVRKRWSDVVVYGCTPTSVAGYVAYRGRLIRIADDDPADQRDIAKAIMEVATELHSIVTGYDVIQALTPQDI